MFKNKDQFIRKFQNKMKTMISKPEEEINNYDAFLVLADIIKEQLNQELVKTNKRYIREAKKQLYYFSIEFLPGKLLKSNLINMRALELCREGLEELGYNLNDLEAEETEPGLGNGGLGRLAACFLDSLASLELPGHGCGIRYKYGLFTQGIVNGHQVELPNYWLNDEFIWEIRRPEKAVEVHFGGDVEVRETENGLDFEHKSYQKIKAVPYDVPIVGFDNNTVNNLRLWNAEVAEDIPLHYFDNEDDRYRYLNYKRDVESIAEFLYPDDSSVEGKLLRLKQEYFLSSAGLQSIFRTYSKYNLPLEKLPEKIALHINDTHPALLIPEMMRILMDEKGMDWDQAWEITTATTSYTNHTLMQEALETWPVEMFRDLLPRIYMIVEEINERFCRKLWELYPGDFDRIAKMAIIADNQVKMAHLAVVGGHSINGVAPLHSKILKEKQMNLFQQAYPNKFNNKTNGITHRRWLIKANPELTALITETIGEDWIYKPSHLIKLLDYKEDPGFRKKIAAVKQKNKHKLADLIKTETGVTVNVNSIFDIQIKRFHAYKRQLLNILHVMHLYNRLKENPNYNIQPRTFIFAGKAAPGYYFAKRIIRLISRVGKVVNQDKEIGNLLKVVFLPDYSVSLAEKIIPAADISEQISTAGKEASGTGNMKLMMNGALTLGTMDGANIDICNLVGEDNIFIFGLNHEEVHNYYQSGEYNSGQIYSDDPRIRQVIDQLVEPGRFADRINEFDNIYSSLLTENDHYFVLKDFAGYAEQQKKIDNIYQDQNRWLEKSIINIAHAGEFSGDSTIAKYATDIWQLK